LPSPFRSSLFAGLLVLAAGGPALAQPDAELEIGGGYHRAFDLGGDWFTVPSTPTVDVRATRWTSERWGLSLRGMVGLGGSLRGHATERRHPSYYQVLLRYRRVGADGTGMHVSFGGGLVGWLEDDGFGATIHLLGIEALVSKAVTDRISIRGGVGVVVPFHVHPVVLLAWQY